MIQEWVKPQYLQSIPLTTLMAPQLLRLREGESTTGCNIWITRGVQKTIS